MSLCPCGSGRPYEECCETYIEGRETAPTAEALMRSRYAAHTLGKYDYLNETVHPSIRDEADRSTFCLRNTSSTISAALPIRWAWPACVWK